MKKCPRCKLPQEGIDECEYCGLVFDKKAEKNSTDPPKKAKKIKKAKKQSTKKKYIISAISVVVAITIVVIFLFGLKNTNRPDYVKDIVTYKEGDGIVFYFVLADKRGRPTAYNGWILYQLTCGLEEPYGISVLQGIKKVSINDFHKTTVGMGAFERDTILYSLGRFSNYILESNIRQYGDVGVKADNQLLKGGITKDYKPEIRKILSKEHKQGNAEIIFVYGDPSPKAIDILNLDYSVGNIKFLVQKIKLLGLLADSAKSKHSSWNIISGEEKVIF